MYTIAINVKNMSLHIQGWLLLRTAFKKRRATALLLQQLLRIETYRSRTCECTQRILEAIFCLASSDIDW